MLFYNSLLQKNKELFIIFLIFLSIFLFNILLEYKNYLNFKENKHPLIQATIIQIYQKKNIKNKNYFVLKLKNKNFTFYTTSFKDLNLSKNENIELRIITTNLNFKDYLSKNFYAPSYGIQSLGFSKNLKIIDYFLNQHKDEKIKEFYGALFFALPISLELRTDINYYGVAHLIAISGYHMGLIFSFLFFILSPIYSFFQKKYFPYRNLKLDLSIIIFIFLIIYAYLIGLIPSYIRSLIMLLWGFYLISKNIKLINFINLFLSICICIALFPRFLFSVGFLFSILGVFYIFLYLHHFSKYFKPFMNVLLLNIWTFFAMILPVMYFFPLLTYQQILAIFISIIFIIFYPLVLFLHFINEGGLLDHYLISFFNFKLYAINFQIPFLIFLAYILLSLLSIRFKLLALLCIFLNLLPFIFI
ncbi:ComEC/Rec2 family competence protein [Campylobacter sp. TTU-622]|uniref:ComEC/Rec2 family competence protein n=1 Tax=unclassified Campylobacter TaxID=2593542 RepID=UPI0019062EE4|nr:MULTISPECIES: ComEC/Rec2 family competence protein [unclassified Campylobacter]MBK1971612.1 ComEC/Rec2 family competence protein [Campylobacter sp. TTU_617]MBK1973109.1 ComEC/Rec2 family competence protein [Campylobacter sp. TTU-622]